MADRLIAYADGITVFQIHISLFTGAVSRSSSLTVSLFGSDTVGDSSATEDTPPVSFLILHYIRLITF